jgi:hypothetical protein
MELAEAKAKLVQLESQLGVAVIVLFAVFDTPVGRLSLYLTERLQRQCRKGKVWKSPGMLSTLKNAAYGFDSDSPRSRGGSDGIFKLDRTFQPRNAMMRKMFDRFLDKPDPAIAAIERELECPSAEWLPVRLVSHHMRLLGVLARKGGSDHLVLVDYDDEKE